MVRHDFVAMFMLSCQLVMRVFDVARQELLHGGCCPRLNRYRFSYASQRRLLIFKMRRVIRRWSTPACAFQFMLFRKHGECKIDETPRSTLTMMFYVIRLLR